MATGDAQDMSSLQQGFGAARGQAASLGALQRNVGVGAAHRGIMQQQQGLNQQQVGAEQQLRLQQQRGAEDQLMQMLGLQRGQDLSFADTSAKAALQNSAVQQALQQFYTGLGVKGTLGNYDRTQQRGLADLGFDNDMGDVSRDWVKGGIKVGGSLLGTLAKVGGS
jgi:hypothetical protein